MGPSKVRSERYLCGKGKEINFKVINEIFAICGNCGVY